jgi:D-psicose/D-tagatose/L-ribulose 3-epimerase
MKYGINLMLFGDKIEKDIQKMFPKIKDFGFDGVEIPIFVPSSIDCKGIADSAADAGLEITCSAALPVCSRFYGKDSTAVKAAADYIQEGIKTLTELGAKVWVGPFYKVVGDHDLSISLDQQREQSIQAMKPLMKMAEDAGIVLGIEPLNRFETNLINTVDQGIEFCHGLDSPAASLLLDTFHMNIEEKSLTEAILKAHENNKLAHFHCSENDRGIPGSGQVRWAEATSAIKESGYDKWMVLETFNQDNQAIKKAACCWRPFYPSADTYMQQGLDFVKKTFN